MSMKARPCAEVSSWRSREGTKAAASSAISLKAASSSRRRGAMGMGQKHAVAKAAAVGQHRRQPVPQRGGVADVAGFHRPFDAAGIGERADRKGRRQPGHQPVQRRRLARVHLANGRPRRAASPVSARTTRLRRGFAGGLLVVMSMGMAVMMVVVAMLVVVMVVIMVMVIMMIVMHDRATHGRARWLRHARGLPHAHGKPRHRRRLRDRTAPRSRSRARPAPSPSPR